MAHNLKSLSQYLQKLIENRLWLKVIIGMVLGVLVGLIIAPATGLLTKTYAHTLANWLALPGILFMKLVQMIMIPMIVTSIMTGIASNSKNHALQKTGIGLGLYFLGTTFLAVLMGWGVSILMKPGALFSFPQMDLSNAAQDIGAAQSFPPLAELPTKILSVLPSNPLASMVTGEMLSIVLFSIIIGIAITKLSDDQAVPMTTLLRAIQNICMTVVKWAMSIAPYAVFGLMAQLVVNTGLSSILGLASFMFSVLLGLMILLLFYLSLLFFFSPISIKYFIHHTKSVLLLAFSVSSSAAVMPLSIKVAEEDLGVDPSLANLVIPVGATVNMNGTALFQCMGTLFLAHIYGLDLSIISILLMIVTIVAASVGTPSIPGGGIIVMASVLQGVGIPAEGLMILIGIDRIMGMFRTAVNVAGDLTACVLFNQWLGFKSNVKAS